MTVYIEHDEAAARLFASGQVPDGPAAAARLIARQYQLDPDLAHVAAILAGEYGEHWETASARMARCLALAPDRVEIPDAPLDCVGHGRHAPGALQLTGAGLLCRAHLADHALAETPGGDDDGQ